jgi:cytochrome o ubiquinol oxidase subunit 2
MTPRRTAWRTALLSAGVTATVGVLQGCRMAPALIPEGPISKAERIILLNSLAIMLAIVIPVILATLAFAWWFRASNTRARYRPDWEYSGRLELLVWSIPALVILFLGGIAWVGSHDLDPAAPLKSKAPPLEVQVVSLDWKWLFIYPQQGVASLNHLVAPVGTPIHFDITSASVMNVFFVPRLGSQIYAMNGMTSRLNLQADRPGDYPGLSGHFSGDGFSGMAFDLKAVDPAQFSAWVAGAKASGPVLDEAAYRGLLKQSQDVKPYTYRSVQPGLFDAVVSQKLPTGDGPQIGAPSPAVTPRRAS